MKCFHLYKFLAGAAGSVLLAPLVSSAQVTYRVTELLPPEGYSFLNPRGINDDGMIVGSLFDNDPEDMDEYLHRAFRWQAGEVTVLPQPEGYRSADGWGINDHGQIVGRVYAINDTHDDSLTVVWEGDEVRDLAPSYDGGRHAFETAINNLGNFGGGLQTEEGRRAFVLIDGEIEILDTGNGTATLNGLNDDNVGIGVFWSSSNMNWRAFRWDPENGLSKLDDLADKPGLATAYAINNKGTIIGRRWADGFDQAFKFSDGKVYGLGTLGGPASVPHDLNERGEIVGQADIEETISEFFPRHLQRAFFYSTRGGLRDLNNYTRSDSHWVLEIAAAINNHGQIVGTGRKDGRQAAFLLEPLPTTEPYLSTDGEFSVVLSGLIPNRAYIIERSSCLTAWEEVDVLEATEATEHWDTGKSVNEERMFYRIRMP